MLPRFVVAINNKYTKGGEGGPGPDWQTRTGNIETWNDGARWPLLILLHQYKAWLGSHSKQSQLPYPHPPSCARVPIPSLFHWSAGCSPIFILSWHKEPDWNKVPIKNPECRSYPIRRHETTTPSSTNQPSGAFAPLTTNLRRGIRFYEFVLHLWSRITFLYSWFLQK